MSKMLHRQRKRIAVGLGIASLLLGWWLFGQWPDRWTLVGGAIVIACGLYLLARERVRGVTPTPPDPG